LTPGPTILIVEGRKPTIEHLVLTLRDRGYRIVSARTRKGALSEVRETLPTVVVVDSPSLRFSARRLCQALREAAPDTSVLLLLPEGAEIDRSVGARAHLRYPFSAKKLVSRITRLLPIPDDEVLRVGELCLNLKRRSVICNGRESHLTPKQVRLLEVLMHHPGKVLTRAFLMRQVWDTDYVDDTRTLEVHVHWLRKALGKDADAPACLHTVRRVGYRLDVPGTE
jgi:DNA-binding response OmpR family regulator